MVSEHHPGNLMAEDIQYHQYVENRFREIEQKQNKMEEELQAIQISLHKSGEGFETFKSEILGQLSKIQDLLMIKIGGGRGVVDGTAGKGMPESPPVDSIQEMRHAGQSSTQSHIILEDKKNAETAMGILRKENITNDPDDATTVSQYAKVMKTVSENSEKAYQFQLRVDSKSEDQLWTSPVTATVRILDTSAAIRALKQVHNRVLAAAQLRKLVRHRFCNAAPLPVFDPGGNGTFEGEGLPRLQFWWNLGHFGRIFEDDRRRIEASSRRCSERRRIGNGEEARDSNDLIWGFTLVMLAVKEEEYLGIMLLGISAFGSLKGKRVFLLKLMEMYRANPAIEYVCIL